MKNFLTFCTLFLGLLFFSNQPLPSQITTTEEITEGKEYWIGLPYSGRELGEAIRGDYPIAIWISSKVDTRAQVSDAATGSVQSVRIRKNQITQVPYGDALMNTQSEVVTNLGIHIVGDDPISVAVYMSYRWSGEAFRCIPIEWTGRKYVTLNMYQDQLQQNSQTDKMYRPPQILIIAQEDNTKVQYKPATSTDHVAFGSTGQTMLNKGQTFLIFGKIKELQSQLNSTDLSGTYIEATNPITVISGHTKACYPRLQNTFLGRNGGFMRNMMTETMWPIELLGTDYVSAPIKYDNRPRGVVQDDIGDLIRFVATEDNTTISQMRQDGSGLKQISPILKRGQWYDIVNQDQPAFYHASSKVLVGQYGKTWLDHLPTPGAKGDGDDPQNPSRNGQGMMIVLAPFDHWTSYATWKSPQDIDDFFYITFKAAEMDHLYIGDGSGVPVKLSVRFGNAIHYINGTEYAYIAESVSPGDHFLMGDTLEGGKVKATFAAYAYGNWDRSKDGFAYGYPIGINYNVPCVDSLVVKDTMICGEVTGIGNALPADAECASIFNAFSSDLVNYTFEIDPNFKPGDKNIKYFLHIMDMTKDASGKVKVMCKSGKTIVKSYEYHPEIIKVDPTSVDYGMLQVGDVVKGKTITITNTGVVPVTIKKLYLKNGRKEFDIQVDPSVYPIILQPKESKVVEIWASAPEMTKETIRDSVRAELSCYDVTLNELKYIMGAPVVWIGDAHWSPQLINTQVPKQVQIKNTSTVEVVLTTMDWPAGDKVVFSKVEGLPTVGTQGGDFSTPLKLAPYETKEFTVWYTPDAVGTHQTRAIFKGNTDVDKLYSDWDGSCVNAGPFIQGKDWGIVRLIDGNWVKDEYTGEVLIWGEGTTKLDVNKVWIEGTDAAAFRLDQTYVPTQIDPNINNKSNPIHIPAYFKPTAEKDYSAIVKFEATVSGNGGATSTVQDDLKGTGAQPHVGIIGHDFTTPIEIGTSLNDFGHVYYDIQNQPDSRYSWPLRVFKLHITGPDADAFTIDDQYLNPQPEMTLLYDKTWDIPVKFTAKHAGKHEATLTVESDAPETPVGRLTGYGYAEGLLTTNFNYGVIWKSTFGLGQVYLQNTGTEAVQIIRDIDDPAGLVGDVNAFNVTQMTWKREKDPTTNNPKAPITLDPGEKLFVDVKFTALDAIPYTFEIEYKTLAPNALPDDYKLSKSILMGEGKVIKTVAQIPNYPETTDPNMAIKPGDPVNVSFNIIDAPGETKALETAGITEFKARVIFKNPADVSLKDVFPSGTPQRVNIITDNTLTKDFNVQEASVLNNTTLQVHFTQKDPNNPVVLKGPGTLFKFIMNTYLSNNVVVPLHCDFQVLSLPQVNYVLVDTIPGSIKVSPVCVNDGRLIKFFGSIYELEAVNPNPVTTDATITYSVALTGRTTICLYSSMGDKVLTLVDKELLPGTYEISFNPNELGIPSGAYRYVMESGPFTDSKPLTIVK